MLESYRKHVEQRAALNVPPLPLDAEQTAALCDLLKNPAAGEADFLMELLCDRIPPGVDPASYVNATKQSSSPMGGRLLNSAQRVVI